MGGYTILRYFVLGFLPFIAIFLESTFFRTYSLFGNVPDLVLIFVVFYAFLNGDNKGAVYGFLCGLLEDLYMGRFIGVNALSKGITGFIIGRLQVRYFNENLLVGLLVVLIGTVLNSLFMLALGLSTFKIFNLDTSIISASIFQSLYNLLLAVPGHPPLHCGLHLCLSTALHTASPGRIFQLNY
jgi:rod shape-determining protein MreD